MVALQELRREVAGRQRRGGGLGGQPARVEAVVDALAAQRRDVAGGVAHHHHAVGDGGLQRPAHGQRRSLHRRVVLRDGEVVVAAQQRDVIAPYGVHVDGLDGAVIAAEADVQRRGLGEYPAVTLDAAGAKVHQQAMLVAVGVGDEVAPHLDLLHQCGA